MSKPRYKWWGYVKWVIRDYPFKRRELDAMRQQSFGASDGLPHGTDAQRATENIALRGFSGQKEREYYGVTKAIDGVKARPEGFEILHLVDLVFWKQTHTLQGAADQCHVSYRTATQWHGDFVRSVARNMGLMD